VTNGFVVDASVTLKLLVDEPGREYARLFFKRLSDPNPVVLYAPDLLYVECANTIWKYVTRYHYSPRHAQASLDALAALAIQAIPTQLIFQEAFNFSLRYRITTYDACYLALAEQFRCPLVTEDTDLIRQVRPHTKVPLYQLSEVE